MANAQTPENHLVLESAVHTNPLSASEVPVLADRIEVYGESETENEAVAFIGRAGDDLSLVQAISIEPDVVVKTAARVYQNSGMAVRASLEARGIEATDQEVHELILQVLEANRGRRERSLESRLRFFEGIATDQQLEHYRSEFLADDRLEERVDTSELEQIVGDTSDMESYAVVRGFDWLSAQVRPLMEKLGKATLRAFPRQS